MRVVRLICSIPYPQRNPITLPFIRPSWTMFGQILLPLSLTVAIAQAVPMAKGDMVVSAIPTAISKSLTIYGEVCLASLLPGLSLKAVPFQSSRGRLIVTST